MARTTRRDLVGTNVDILPREVQNNIWEAAVDQAVIPKLTAETPIILGDNLVPVITQDARATVVGEGDLKVGSDMRVGAVKIVPMKVQVGVEFTEETIAANPGGILGVLQEKLAGAIARQVDAAVLHKLTCAAGNAITTDSVALASVSNAVKSASDPAKVRGEIDDAYNLTAKAGYGWTGFAASPVFVGLMRKAKKSTGDKEFPEIGYGAAESFDGVPLAVSRVVGGGVDGIPAQKLLAVGGDFQGALRFGRVGTVTVRRVEYGDPFGNGDLQGHGSVAYIGETICGWGVLDQSAFARIYAA